MNAFYEDDEPLEAVIAAFNQGQHVRTGVPIRTLGCEHLSASGPIVSLACAVCGPCGELMETAAS